MVKRSFDLVKKKTKKQNTRKAAAFTIKHLLITLEIYMYNMYIGKFVGLFVKTLV